MKKYFTTLDEAIALMSYGLTISRPYHLRKPLYSQQQERLPKDPKLPQG